jgi:hypothetical protein
MYQDRNFGEQEEVQQTADLPEFQIGNSPNIDGMSNEVPEKAEESDKKYSKKDDKK